MEHCTVPAKSWLWDQVLKRRCLELNEGGGRQTKPVRYRCGGPSGSYWLFAELMLFDEIGLEGGMRHEAEGRMRREIYVCFAPCRCKGNKNLLMNGMIE